MVEMDDQFKKKLYSSFCQKVITSFIVISAFSLTLIPILAFSQTKKTNILGMKKYSMLSLGDSYTIGEQVLPEERFNEQTKILLETKNMILDPIKTIAKTGWTTDELKTGIGEEKLNTKFDVVTLLIGVNNQYRERDIENYKQEFKELLKMAIIFADNKAAQVFVLSIPDWGVTPFAIGRDTQKIAKEIDFFNVCNKEITLNLGAQYIDITPISRKAGIDHNLIASDLLHPSGKMYFLWAEKLAEKILKTCH